MTPLRLHFSRGFTLWELLAVLIIIAITVAIIFPIFARPRYHRNLSCSSNLKQVGLALIGYTQDYDEKFPPAVGQIRLPDGKFYEQQWGITTYAMIGGKQTAVPAILDGWVKNEQRFLCPAVKDPQSGLTCLYNDLAAGASADAFPSPAYSILVAEGDDHLRNVGHAKSANPAGDEAALSPRSNAPSPKLLLGAAVGNALVRHSGGADYLLADGHVKWMKPDVIFFPPRNSTSKSHREDKTGRLLGPDPSGARTFQGKTYAATFHVR